MALHAVPPPSLVRMGAWADLPARGARNGSLVGAPNALNCRDQCVSVVLMCRGLGGFLSGRRASERPGCGLGAVSPVLAARGSGEEAVSGAPHPEHGGGAEGQCGDVDCGLEGHVG